jgi:hypothetical protein
MATDRKIKDYMNELKVIKYHVKPNELNVGDEYHVPPIISIKRMNIVITGKQGNIVKFKITSDSDKTEKTMDETSILSRFIVKKMKY